MGSPLSRRLSKLPAEEARKAAPEVRPADAPPPPAPEKPAEETRGYIPPPKRRTTPRVAELRRQLRPKLLAAPNEADEWRRDNPEHQKIIVDRLNIFLQRANLQLPKPEYDELREALWTTSWAGAPSIRSSATALTARSWSTDRRSSSLSGKAS
jgi:hypothetical protein